MKVSRYFFVTLKEKPSDAEARSHALMVRAGLIVKSAAGIYTFTPLGFRTLHKIIGIIREELNKIGAMEMVMPILQPADVWKESGRWSTMGKELVRLKDRNGRDFVLAPTAEEVVVDVVRRFVHSYRQLPLLLYQILSKYRDEPRPRFGVIRAREFVMKDMYSFDADERGLEESYRKAYDAYCKIFSRVGVNVEVVEAFTGAIGGSVSHEFVVPAEIGESALVKCKNCGYSANVEVAEALPEALPFEEEKPKIKVKTPNVKSIGDLAEFLGVSPKKILKGLLYSIPESGEVVLAIVRGDRTLNEAKLAKALGVPEVEMVPPEEAQKRLGIPVGFVGPVGIKGISSVPVKIVADREVKFIRNAVSGANEADMHILNVNCPRDFTVDMWADIREVEEGDLCPRCKGAKLERSKGIEVGHIFKLGTKYSKAMNATFLDKDGKEKHFIMGCYGIGVTRLMAAYIEENSDENGIIWNEKIAPFEVAVLPLQTRDGDVMRAAESIERGLEAEGVEVLLDDRDESPGVKFKDADLVGFPWRVVVSKKTLADEAVELKNRRTGEVKVVSLDGAVEAISKIVREARKR